MDMDAAPLAGRVLGTEDATPLEFWVAVAEGSVLQLDDVVALGARPAVGRRGADLRHRRPRFGPATKEPGSTATSSSSRKACSRPRSARRRRCSPPASSRRCSCRRCPALRCGGPSGRSASEALFFDGMERRLPAGLSRDDEPLYLNLDFVDGTRGAHVNISGISGVATKTSYATFLLYSLFESGVLGPEAVNTKALVFNVKGEDLLWLDRPNRRLDDRQAARYARLGLPVDAFPSVAFFAPPRRGAATTRAGRDQPRHRHHVVLLDAGGLLPRRAAARSSSPTPRTIASSTRWSSTTSPPGSARPRPPATAPCASTARWCGASATWSSWCRAA